MARGEPKAPTAATRAVTRNNEQQMRRNPPCLIVAPVLIRHDLSIFILEVIFGRSPIPSENFKPRYKKNGDADFQDLLGLGRVAISCLNQMQATHLPLQRRIRSLTGFAYFNLRRCGRLLFFAEFLEIGIAAQSIPYRIKPKKRWRNGCRAAKPAIVGDL